MKLFEKSQNRVIQNKKDSAYQKSHYLHHGDIIYNQAYATSFHQKIESVQYDSALAITDSKRGTSKERLYKELGLKTLEKRK